VGDWAGGDADPAVDKGAADDGADGEEADDDGPADDAAPDGDSATDDATGAADKATGAAEHPPTANRASSAINGTRIDGRIDRIVHPAVESRFGRAPSGQPSGCQPAGAGPSTGRAYANQRSATSNPRPS
jgi:hypothetical protein